MIKALNNFVIAKPLNENIGGFTISQDASSSYKKAKVISSTSDRLINSNFILLLDNYKTITYNGEQFYICKEDNICIIDED